MDDRERLLMRILLVDDDIVDRETVRRALGTQADGENLVEANSAEQGLALTQESQFDAVLLDYRLPQIDGLEMIARLRSRPNLGNTAIVMMSSEDDEQLALLCLQAGAQDFIPKSEITATKLRRAIVQAQKRFELECKLYDSYCRVREMAETDALTGLANRYFFERDLSAAITANVRQNKQVALLLLDLDHFKNINDTYGHFVGDKLLKTVVKKISDCLRGEEMFARLGGDEFAIILKGLEHANEAQLVARRIIKSLEKSMKVGDQDLQCGVSIGIALHPSSAETAEELTRFADIAMYRAKNSGRNRLCYFQDVMQQQFSRNFQIELALKSASHEQCFELHYQPIVRGINKKLVGFEALIRWPTCTLDSNPCEFIPIAEQCGLIGTIGKWVIKTAVKQLAIWQKKYNIRLTMGINLSPVQLADTQLTNYILQNLEYYHVAPESLILELTETALFIESEQNKDQISQLAKLGCKLALDDFGTGFSSLSHLVNFPIDIVKLDRSLLPESPDHLRHMAIVRGLAEMAHTVGLKVIAEGVETSFHFLLCKDLKIEEIQGYFFDKPASSSTIEKKWLDNIITP